MEYAPLILQYKNQADSIKLNSLVNDEHVTKFDTIKLQIADLIHVRNPSKTYLAKEMKENIEQHLSGLDPIEYGCWIYYPWCKRLVHTLPEQQFIEVRTNRNLHKITVQEQQILAKKRVGIIGLSVGQSVALTMAIERACGELVIADFDTLELSNLNRIRSGIHNIGLSKVAMVAREIAEIDPYLKVTCYSEGIHAGNLSEFLSYPTNLDVLIDECDSLNIKIEARKEARKLGIPVLMDTSDRGLLDIERFDVEPSRPLFHGCIKDMESEKFEDLTVDQRLSIIAQIVGANTVSSRLKASVLEMGFSNRAWPQLASAVALGGSVVTDTARRIMLNESVVSGRYYIDIAEKILKKAETNCLEEETNSADSWDELNKVAEKYLLENNKNFTPHNLSKETITLLVKSACAAPSSGNNQPWKWVHKRGVLFLFHDTSRTKAFGDFLQIPTYISMGAAVANIILAASNIGLEAIVNEFPIEKDLILIAAIYFQERNSPKPIGINLAEQIFHRGTDRRYFKNEKFESHHLANIKQLAVENETKASIQILEDPQSLEALGNIVAEMDRLRLLHPIAHKDYFTTELRWSTALAQTSGDGIDLHSLYLSGGDTVNLQLLSDPSTSAIINTIGGGEKLLKNSIDLLKSASSIIFITMPEHLPQHYFHGGKLMEKIWLYCTAHNIAVQPIVSPLYFFYRHLLGNNKDLNSKEIEKIASLRNDFSQLFNTKNHYAEIVMLRMGKAMPIVHTPIRRSIDDVLWIEDDLTINL